ncbi:hypothetical protein QCA50_005067 [Cerrena zonata]|uniref:Halogenase n=1 Tax=Cerrena zonata TaxID=2478898 RepID=A0AAW0GN63_9APHY
MLPPTKTQILVIGGGPAGSYSASALAREGFDVVILELAHFPRKVLSIIRFWMFHAEYKIAQYGFVRKPGSAIKFNQYMQEGYTDFVALGASNAAWNVTRSTFDEILLRHAQENGVKVFEGVRVTSIDFVDSPSKTDDISNEDWKDVGRPVRASYVTDQGEAGEIEFDYLIDASGRAGVMSTKYLKNRRYNDSLKNVAIWGYWQDTDMYGRDTPRENAPFFEALSDESGWAWFIPLHNGLTSVGIVMDQKQLGIRSRAYAAATGQSVPFPAASTSNPIFAPSTPTSSTPSSSKSDGADSPNNENKQGTSNLAERYLSFIPLAPGVLKLIGEKGKFVGIDEDYTVISEYTSPFSDDHPGPKDSQNEKGKDVPMARTASDFSYSCGRYAGDRWRIIGDAGAFIDPFFSSGVHLACTGALSAATSIAASLRGDCSEAEAAEWCHQRITISYTRFLVVVLSAYKQIRSQSVSVLADIKDENFDKAFAFLRPVIQGGAEMGAKLSEDEVQRALDFCVNLFSPTTPEQHASVREKLRSLQSSPQVPLSPSGDGAQTPCTPPRPRFIRPPPLQRANTSSPHSRQLSMQILTSMTGLGIREEDDVVGDEDAERRLMDVHAPIVSPRTLTQFLKTKFNRTRSNTMPAPRVSGFVSPPTSPTTSSFGVDLAGRNVKGRRRSGTVSTMGSRSRIGQSIVSTPALSMSSSLSGLSTPRSPLSSVPSDDESGSEREEFHDAAEHPIPPSDIEDGNKPEVPEEEEEGGETEDDEEEVSEMKMVLDKVNARRVIHAEHGGLNGLESEAVAGFVVRLVRGDLGLSRAAAQEE